MVAPQIPSLGLTTEPQAQTVMIGIPKVVCADDSQRVHPETYAKLVVIGASAVDITAKVNTDEVGRSIPVANTTAPGTVSLTLGGVARNVAEAAHRVFSSGPVPEAEATLLLSPVGGDNFATTLVAEHTRLGMRVDGFLHASNCRTAVCNMVLDANGQLVGGVADMDIIHDIPSKPVREYQTAPIKSTVLKSSGQVLERLQAETRANLIAMDGNLSKETLSDIILFCSRRGIDSEYLITAL